MRGIVIVFLFLGVFSLAVGKCKVLKEDRYKERAYNLYVKALKLYEENKLKEAYRTLKQALEIYDTDEDYIPISYECSKLIPGAYLPIRKKYFKEDKKEYDVYKLMRNIKLKLYPKLLVILKISSNRLRVSVYNLGNKEDTLPADDVKVIVWRYSYKDEKNLGDIGAGEKKEIVIEGGGYSKVEVKERYGFTPFPIDLKPHNEVY
ncbi:MAG: hypothetical protein DSY42_02635 [Aquifex sp.]|nr:MAG: hypothetical protein DSY42_02635 [Aquifex sp.]